VESIESAVSVCSVPPRVPLASTSAIEGAERKRVGHMSQDVESWSAIVRNSARRHSLAAGLVGAAAADIAEVALAIAESLGGGGKILVFGNGGSAASAQHFAAEYTGKLSLDRRALAAIALTTDPSAVTAIANDYGYERVFERQVLALAGPGDFVIGLSTSGTSANVINGLTAARHLGARTLMLAGPVSAAQTTFRICVPISETARIQEAHDLILHSISAISERVLVPDLADDKGTDRFPFVLGFEDLDAYRTWVRDSGQTLVTTNGVFDLLHEGHRSSLRQARALGDRLVVLVNSDESVRAIKGPDRPVRLLGDRIADLLTIPEVDHVVVMEDLNPSRLLGILRTDVHCKGAEYAPTGVTEEGVVTRGGGRMAYLTRVDGYSTSAQIARSTGEADA